MLFLLSSSPDGLATALASRPSATVEAEYGDRMVAGSVMSMAHHGPRAGQPAPCSYPNGCGEGVEVVGLSHFDLDTLGGCMALLGVKPEAPGFWAVAEFVDLNGPHKLGESGASTEDLRRLHAFWAWSSANKVFAARDGSVTDVTDKILAGAEVTAKILADDPALLAAGDAYRVAEEELNRSSFVEGSEDVLVRESGRFVNHLYTAPDGTVCAAVVGLNSTTGAITVSFADAPKGASAREIVQGLWGELAGGHAGIAGSPRDRVMTREDLAAAAEATRKALRGE